jgi:glutamyl-tRNA reductase
MQLFAVGLNHQSAPLEVREQIAFPAETLAPALRQLAASRAVEEVAILSTCNRTEIYCRTAAPQAVQDWLSRYHSLERHQVASYLYQLQQDAAVAHAFRVASGLDSMVLGEAQILGQMKDAVRTAAEAGTLGWLLNKLFQQTFAVAKEVRTQTEIGANSVSMAAASVRLAARVFGEISAQSVIFIGAGEMIELCATHFAAQRPKRIAVANRTLERAQVLADKFSGSALTLAELPEHLASYDIVVSSTASSLPIIGKGLMERVVKVRRHRPIVMVDLAVPRDVEAEVAQLDDVYLYSVDDLAHIVREGVEARKSAVGDAETIIHAHVEEFRRWLGARDAVPTIKQLREHAERLRSLELERARKALARGDDPNSVLEALSQGLANKFLHQPMRLLSMGVSEGVNGNEAAERDELVRVLNRIYPPAEQ